MYTFVRLFGKNFINILTSNFTQTTLLSNNQKDILNLEVPFYSKLSLNQKKRFEQRIVEFIRIKDFYGMNGLEVTSRMRLLIASTAITLSFSFKDYNYSSFKKILIYPEGETHSKLKPVVFSWKSL